MREEDRVLEGYMNNAIFNSFDTYLDYSFEIVIYANINDVMERVHEDAILRDIVQFSCPSVYNRLMEFPMDYNNDRFTFTIYLEKNFTLQERLYGLNELLQNITRAHRMELYLRENYMKWFETYHILRVTTDNNEIELMLENLDEIIQFLKGEWDENY